MEPLSWASRSEGCNVHRGPIVTYVGAVSFLCDTFSAQFPYLRRSNSSSELKADARGFCPEWTPRQSSPEPIRRRDLPPGEPPSCSDPVIGNRELALQWGFTSVFSPVKPQMLRSRCCEEGNPFASQLSLWMFTKPIEETWHAVHVCYSLYRGLRFLS